MDPSSPYSYKILEHPDSTIRLIKILSIAPEIRCEFSVVSLKDEPVFSALSYTWGDASLKHTIFIDGGSVSITTNLAHALRDVFGQWSSGCHTAPEDTQWLWADAICINQQDTNEKNHQVPLMGAIYSSAVRTFAWLGVENEQTSLGLLGIETVWHHITELSHFDWISTVAQRYGSDLQHWVENKLTPEDLHLDWQRLYTCLPEQLASVDVFDAIAELTEVPYWKRLWIVQELVLSPHAVFISGTKTTTWEKLRIVVLWQSLFERRCEFSVRPSIVPYKQWISLTKTPLKGPRAIALARGIKSLGVLNHKPARHEDYTATTKSIMTGFLFAQRNYSYQATNPKDFIYAMAGWTDICIPVDYSAEKTISQVYLEFVELWLTTYETTLDDVHSEYDMRGLWFLDLAGSGYPWKKTPDLPSWAPDFAGLAEGQTEDTFVDSFKYHKYNVPNVFPGKSNVPRLFSGQLHCRGALIDKISEISPLIVPRVIDQDGDGDGSCDTWRLWVVDCIARQRLQFDKRDKLFEFACAFLCKLTPKPHPIHSYLFLTELAYVCEKWRNMPRASFGRYLGLDDEQVHMLSVDPIEAGRRIYLERMARFLSVGEPNPEDYVTIKFVEYAFADLHVARKRMAYTHSAGAGMFPPLIQSGDLIFHLEGYPLPVVLRQKSTGSYDFVGACYIPKFMKGQAGESIKNGQVEVQSIILA